MWIHNNSQKLYIGTAGTQSNWLRWEFFLVTFFKRKAWNSTHRRYSGFTASLPHWGLLVDILQQFCQLFTSAQVNLALWPANYQQFTVHPVALNFRHHVTACVLSLCLPRACISLCSLFLRKLWTANQSICNWSHVTMQQWDGINHTHADVHFACLIICCKNGPKQTFSERWRESFTVTSKKNQAVHPRYHFQCLFLWTLSTGGGVTLCSQRNDWVPLRSDFPQCCWACGFPTKWPQRCQRRESPRAHQNRSVLQGHCGLLTSVATNRQTPKTVA